jgi:hypothetical protein
MNAQQYQAEVMDELKQRMIIENDAENGKYDKEYAAYLMDNIDIEMPICNGVMLIAAMESGYLWNEFIDYLVYLVKNA